MWPCRHLLASSQQQLLLSDAAGLLLVAARTILTCSPSDVLYHSYMLTRMVTCAWLRRFGSKEEARQFFEERVRSGHAGGFEQL